jgi:putative peptide zinc metalloprotease protein
VSIDGRQTTIDQGGRRYVDDGSRVDVPAGSQGRLTFPGGSAAVLCANSQTAVGRLWTAAGRHREPHGVVAIESGRLLADTTSTSGAFRPLSLVVRRPLGNVQNTGQSWYAVDQAEVALSSGAITVGGTASTPTGTALTCGDDVAVTPPAAGPSESPSDQPSLGPPTEVTPSASLSVSPTPSTTPTTIPEPGQTVPANPTATTKPPTATTKPPTTSPPTTKPTTKPPTTRPTTLPPTTAPPTTTPTTAPPTADPSTTPVID